MRILILSGVAVLTLSACASTGERSGGFGDTTAELSAKCRERGGILIPTGRPSTGRPEADYACQLNGGSRIPSPAREAR